MPRGSYKIQDGIDGGGDEAHMWSEVVARPPERSLSTCLMALVLFFFLCVVIVLAAWPWKGDKSTSTAETGSPLNEGLSGEKIATIPVTSPYEETHKEKDLLLPTSLSTPKSTVSSTLPVDVIKVEGKNTLETDESKKKLVEGKNTLETDESKKKLGSHEDLVTDMESTSTSSEEETTKSGTDEFGWNPDSMSYASRMLALMDHSADPCYDIYSFACGGMKNDGGEWISEDLNELKPMQRILDLFQKYNPSKSTAKNKFKMFIQKCIEYEEKMKLELRLEQAKTIIDDVGMFLLREIDNGSISDLLINLLLHNYPVIFDVQLEPEKIDKLILKLSLPELKSPFGHASENDVKLNGWSRTTCLKIATEKPRDKKKEDDLNARYTKYNQCNRDYSTYIKEVEVALKMLNLFKKEEEEKAKSFIEDTVIFLESEFLKKIQEILPSQSERNINQTKRHSNNVFLSYLQAKFSLVDWQDLVTKLVGHSKVDFLELQVNLHYEPYFEKIFAALESFHVRKLYNGLLAMFAHEIYYGLVINRNSCSRDEYCFAVASHLMPEVVSSLFLSSFHKDQLDKFKSQINNLFDQLKSQLKSEVEAIIWLDDGSRKNIVEKISKMRLIDDGGCPLFLNDTYLDGQFEEYLLSSTYLEDAASLMKRTRKMMYSAINEDPLSKIWSLFVHPYSTKAKALYELNTIVIPYGVMLQPYSTATSFRYLQMATLGTTIAKVMWQHFDETGIAFDYKGERSEPVVDDSLFSIEAVTNCTEKQFQSQKSVKDDGIKVKFQLPQSLSINSRVADIGGVHLAFTTMMKEESGASLPWVTMNIQQLYFLTIAQSACSRASVYHYVISMFEEEDLPPFLRVEDIAKNSREFIEAFSCNLKTIVKPPCVPFTLANKTEVTTYSTSH